MASTNISIEYNHFIIMTHQQHKFAVLMNQIFCNFLVNASPITQSVEPRV